MSSGVEEQCGSRYCEKGIAKVHCHFILREKGVGSSGLEWIDVQRAALKFQSRAVKDPLFIDAVQWVQACSAGIAQLRCFDAGIFLRSSSDCFRRNACCLEMTRGAPCLVPRAMHALYVTYVQLRRRRSPITPALASRASAPGAGAVIWLNS